MAALLPASTLRVKSIPTYRRKFSAAVRSQFRLSELLGGRGLCNGEVGVEQELLKSTSPTVTPVPSSVPAPASAPAQASDAAFEKELMGLTGGFPGGEKGLQRFIEQNPPPTPPSLADEAAYLVPKQKVPAPELPQFLPGMVVIVKNEKNPFHMYCGIVQRVTDGEVGVLFEGGNWDKLLTFRIDELERRDKGPPMVNPKSAVLESIVQKST